ncbi:MAG: hypothetical protein EOP83_11675, partial [Verrucomicrobiaceae bacterium]
PSSVVVNNSTKDYSIGADIVGPCQVTKNGSGTLRLSGYESSYTGGTVVNAGRLAAYSGSGTPLGTGPLSIAGGATLAGNATIPGVVTIQGFVSPDGSASEPLGTLTTGPTTLGGTYICDLAYQGSDRLDVMGDLDLTGSRLTFQKGTYSPLGASSFVIASYTGNLTGSFGTVNGLPTGHVLRYDSAAKQIRVERMTLADWFASFPGLGDASITGDPDLDGIPNLLEYVLGGHPGQRSTAILPQHSSDSSYFLFKYKRSDPSEHDTVQAVQWSTDMVNWTDIPVGNTINANVTITLNGDEPDDITVRIPRSSADGSIFMRLKVVEK